MKRSYLYLAVFVVLLFIIPSVSASEYLEDTEVDYTYSELEESLDLSEMYNLLPDEAKETLRKIGIENISINNLNDVSLSSFFNEITSVASSQVKGVFSSLVTIVAIILITAIFDGYSTSISGGLREVLSVVTALCICSAVVIPLMDVIDSATDIIKTSSDFILAYVPIMVAVLISCGQSISGSGYYSMMVFAAEGISQLSGKFIAPMLSVFMGIGISSTVTPGLNMSGFLSMISKTLKWLLSFVFTMFSTFLGFKTLISSTIDNVSTRAIRFTMSSFVPVIGAALSEAYKTVQGSVHLLKNGIGVFAIIAVIIVFMPILIKILLWLISVNLCKSFSQMLDMSVPTELLLIISTVLSVLLAIIICIMALYIISTALIISLGGNMT